MTILCGLIVGATMIVPGASGGSMAMILGIYDSLITAAGSFRKNFLQNLFFLASFALSALLGIFLFSSPLSWLLEHFPMQTMYFFLGAVFGGIPMIIKKSSVKKWSSDTIICILAGMLAVLMFSLIPVNVFQAGEGVSLKYGMLLLIMGIPAASALVLPGISVSHFFLIMGWYDRIIEAVRGLELAFLIPLGMGILLGIMLTAKMLEYMMTKYTRQTYLVILGFIAGSFMEIFPGIPDINSLFVCMGLLAAGFFSAYLISKKEFEGE